MAKPIRVLQVIGQMNRGGAESMIMNIYRNIDRSVVQFDFVEHYQQEASYDQEIYKLGGRIYRCPRFNTSNIIKYVLWWKTFFEKEGREYRIIHGHIGSTASIYLGIAKKNGLFTIAHSHGVFNQINVKNLEYYILSFPTRYIADYCFGCSEDALVSRFGKERAFNHEISSVLKNGINIDNFKYDQEKRELIRKELGITDKKVIGHVGRFDKVKNHSFLIDIFDEIIKKNDDYVLLLVGDGDQRTAIENRIHQLRLEQSVLMTGMVSNVQDYINAMDIIAFPSLSEGLPVSLIEAQANGIPIVLSNRVSAEVKLNPNVFFLDLDKGKEVWADSIIDNIGKRINDPSKALKEGGYDINLVAKELQSFYCNHV